MTTTTLPTHDVCEDHSPADFTDPFSDQIREFREFGTATKIVETQAQLFDGDRISVPTYVNEFWTAKQRQASSLHEVSYRACFKPQLPRFFIQRLTQPGDVVYDPFMGRGTTPVEAALHGRIPWGNDLNPLSLVFTAPRLLPPHMSLIQSRLREVTRGDHDELPEDLLVFYHPDTLRDICALRTYFLERISSGQMDLTDAWLRMVAMSRLTGHSPGFFSVYTLPPNQAVSVSRQRTLNQQHNRTPPRRDVVELILKKSKQLLGDVTPLVRQTLTRVSRHAWLLKMHAEATPQIPSDSVSLVVTSPPFLDVVNYAEDNWLRCWFAGIDAKSVTLTTPARLDAWATTMTGVFRELHRVVKPGGHVAFEVGEVHGGKTKLEESALPCGVAAGFEPVLVLINDQEFTKTANCWGVKNNHKGTNTNRVVVFRKVR
jgi:hypothetical protein